MSVECQEADRAATRALLRCWIREMGIARPEDGTLRLPMRATGITLTAEVTYWSRCGWHEFGAVRITGNAFGATAEIPTGSGPSETAQTAEDATADAATVAVLIAREACAGRGHGPAEIADLVGRVIDSTQRIAYYLERNPGTGGADSFLAAEQASVLGHPLHPTPKSRDGLELAEDAIYGPELRGSFPLQWFAVARDAVGQELADEQAATDAAALLASLAGFEPPPGTVLVPVHPLQARRLLRRPELAGVLVRDLGRTGPLWSATSSVRTVYRADAAYMLKLSLGLRITNSVREHLPAELPRGTDIHRLLDAGLGAALTAAWPDFGIVRDPAWLAVPGVPGLEVVVRENPFGRGARIACVAGLIAERTVPAAEAASSAASALAELIRGLAARTGRRTDHVAADWVERYLWRVVAPVLWLHATCGLGLEAHQQNTLVTLDDDGWPAGGWYRDNQGYYVSPSRSAPLYAMVPDLGKESELVNPDEVIDERLAYYVGVNNVLGLIGALGSHGLADEESLLRRARAVLESLAKKFGPDQSLPWMLLESPVLRCKANLLTRVDGLDELAGPVETQSVYVDIANPLEEVR